MSSLTLIVTDAGRAALVNAENTGTAPVLIAQVGITTQAFAADATTAALPGELKRLVTFAGAAVASDTIHVSIRDDSADVYSLRGFALYLDDGTLFAAYGQADPIGEKSAQSMFLLALDVIFADINAASLSFGDTNFSLSSATTEREGIVELATEAEATTGTDAQRAVVPKGLKAALDARFGAGAPSGFVKSLLTAVTALACRTALGIKPAATYDVGAGKGLDADLLDGQHGAYYRAWGNLTDVPSAFPPLAHQHAWIDISNPPAQATRWADWIEVTNKPATFTPSPHSQDWSTILNIPATASRWPAWSEVTGKPTVQAQLGFTPVQQGTGVGQTTNAVKIGWSAIGLKCTIDGSDQGVFAFHDWVSSAYMHRSGGVFTGNVGIGIAAGAPLDVSTGAGRLLFRTENGISSIDSVVANNSAFAPLGFYATGYVFSGGSITAPGFASAASSRTVKHAIETSRYGLTAFRKLRFVEYRYDECITPDDRLRFGVIAEEVAEVAPELVIEREGDVPTVEYDQFIPVLGRALQQYIARTDAQLQAAKGRAALADARLARLTDDLADALARIRALERR